MNKKKKRTPFVWCSVCRKKKPPSLTSAAFLVPVRKRHYDLNSEGSAIEKKLTGICVKCLESKNDFQRSNKQPVDADNEHLVYRSAE